MVWRRSPPGVLAVLYILLIVLGSALLWLPIAHRGPFDLGDAIFTSASAVTVTGLSVVDIGQTFTFFGQAVILVLMQLGGFGLMSFAVLLLFVLGIPIGMPQRFLLREEINQSSLSNLTAVVRTIALVSLSCELVGALLLALVWVPEFGLWRGLWISVFHSVSAFNNAGFALWPDSLSQWVDNPIVNIVVPALFIIGGLGFIVLDDIVEAGRWRRLSLHSKLMLTGTAVLILSSWVIFAYLEWNNPYTLGALPNAFDRLMASFFQATTPRTAGFNTLDISKLHDSTTIMIMALMVIGGGSTSTAGGIKVTTLCVLLIATVTFFRRRTALHSYGRSLGPEEVMKVMALTTVSALVIVIGLFLTAIAHDGDFLDLAFEVISAFGTVGLSRGATPDLDSFGRSLVIAEMFLGRVGPLTLGFFLATRTVPRVRYPRGRVFLG